MKCAASTEMERTAQSISNGHAVGSTECKLLANGTAPDADRLDAKQDVKHFLDDAKANADFAREESDEADAEMSDEEQPTVTGCDRVEPLSLADSLWKLDRRASGHLFWRRDSSTLQDGVDPSSRVKFRYDVTVREYAEQQQESEHEDDEEESAEEQEEVDDKEGSVLRQRKGLTVARETDNAVKNSTGVASSPIGIYSAVFLAIVMAAAIHWYLWGRTAWANLTGARRGGSV